MASNRLTVIYKCDIDTSQWHNLSPGARYEVNGISKRDSGPPWYRVTNDLGNEMFYSALCFEHLQLEKTA